MTAVENLVQSVKKSCDNDSLMFCFKGDPTARAYDRLSIFTLWKTAEENYSYTYTSEEVPKTDEHGDPVIGPDGNPVMTTKIIRHVTNENAGTGSVDENGNYTYVPGVDEYTYYCRVILPRMISQGCLNIYYKNNNGVWVDYRKCLAVYPNLSIAVSAVRYENNVKIDINDLPKCIFMDSSRYLHYIDEHDGQDNDNALSSIEIDTNDQNQVSFRPYSLVNPTLPMSAVHVMPDLKISLKEDKSISDFLIWLNGAFVPVTKDSTYKNVGYLESAMSMIDTKVVNQKLNAKKKTSSSNATVELDESNNEYRYDVRLRFFGWQGVKISPWYKPLQTETVPITHNYSSLQIVKTIVFPEEVNEDAHFIMLNGVVVDPSEYEIDAEDKRKITLTNVERDAYALLQELVSDIQTDAINGTSYYANVKPLMLISDVLTKRTYSLVNFKSTDESKTLHMKHSTACAANFPYYREITFPTINCGDLVLVNGTYNRYEWIHQNSISFPKFAYSYNEEESTLKEDEITRIYFVLE